MAAGISCNALIKTITNSRTRLVIGSPDQSELGPVSSTSGSTCRIPVEVTNNSAQPVASLKVACKVLEAPNKYEACKNVDVGNSLFNHCYSYRVQRNSVFQLVLSFGQAVVRKY